MFNNFKRVVTFVLVISLLLVDPFSYSTTADECVEEDETIYVDGIEFKATQTDEGLLIESAEGEEFLQIYEDGTAQAYACDENGKLDYYDLQIEQLNDDNAEVMIYEDEVLVDEINEIDELISDEYEGQVTVAITAGAGITVTTLLTVAAYATLAIVIGGVICWAVDRVIDDIKNTKYYFRAYRRSNLVFINPTTISYSAAVSRIKSGSDVYTYYKSLAYSVTKGTGDGVVGPENHYKWAWAAVGAKYFDHYHTSARTAHVFYGIPRYRALKAN